MEGAAGRSASAERRKELVEASDFLFSVRGATVRTLVSGAMPAGFHAVVWDGTDDRGGVAASGIYFYQIQAGDFVKTRKMERLK